MSFQQVHVRVNDAVTGKPTPARLRITDAAGNYYAPHGRLTEFATGPNQDVGGNVLVGVKPWAYIDGACEILLPPGPLHVEIAKGPEYKLIDEDMTLIAGKMALRFVLQRWSDVRQSGWHSGDARTHFLSTEAAALEGGAEDLALVQVLAKEITTHDPFGKPVRAIPNLIAFSGQHFAATRDACAVAVGTLNTHPELGSLGLLHCHRVVYPLSFGGAGGRENWTLADWCGQCHRKKGLVLWTNPQHETDDFLYGEPLANLVLGDIDAFELSFFEDSPFDALADYYRLLNAGLVVPLVGASAKDSNGIVLGTMRTYAHLAEFSHANWIEAVRTGRCYASNGPLLDFTINGQVPGTHLELPAPGELAVRAEAKSWLPFERLELVQNGQVIASALATSEQPCHALLEYVLPVEHSGWLAVRCQGTTLLPSRPGPQRIFAHSSAVRVQVGSTPAWIEPKAVERLLGELDAMLRWAHDKARCDTPHDRHRLCHVFEEARTRLGKSVASVSGL